METNVSVPIFFNKKKGKKLLKVKTLNKRPRDHIAHLINTGHTFYQLAVTFEIKDMILSLIQIVEFYCEVAIYLFYMTEKIIHNFLTKLIKPLYFCFKINFII